MRSFRTHVSTVEAPPLRVADGYPATLTYQEQKNGASRSGFTIKTFSTIFSARQILREKARFARYALSVSGAMSFRILSFSAVALVALGLSSPALAGEPESASVLFERGRQAMDRNDAAAACRDFTASLRLAADVGTYFGLARCEEALGRIATALEHLRAGIDRLPAEDPRRLESVANAVRLERRAPKLRIRVPSSANAHVFRDGTEVDDNALQADILVDPGHHEVVVVAADRGTATYPVDIGEGDFRLLEAKPGPTFRAQAKARRLQLLGYGSGAVGGALVATGIVTGIVAATWAHVVHDHCDATHVCDERGTSALDHAHGFSTASNVTWISGGVLAGAGVVLYLLGRRALNAPVGTTASSLSVRF